MARDLAALFRISNVINSIRDSGLLQRELLRLIFEVIPAEEGAVVLLTDLDEETYAICTWNRKPDVACDDRDSTRTRSPRHLGAIHSLHQR